MYLRGGEGPGKGDVRGLNHARFLHADNENWTDCDRKLFPLRKHAYSNILKFYHQKIENFQIKKSDIFHIFAQNIDCVYSLEPPRRGGSNEYPQSMFWAEIRKNNVYPCKPQFYCIKVGFEEVKII